MEPLVRKGRRLFRGKGSAAAANNNFVGLYNNSGAAELIVIWGWSIINVAATFTAFGFTHQGKQGSLVMAGQPVLGGEAAGPGQIFNGANSATDTLDWSSGTFTGAPIMYLWDIPFAILQPGWMFGFTTGPASAIAFDASYLYQVCFASEVLPDN